MKKIIEAVDDFCDALFNLLDNQRELCKATNEGMREHPKLGNDFACLLGDLNVLLGDPNDDDEDNEPYYFDDCIHQLHRTAWKIRLLAKKAKYTDE